MEWRRKIHSCFLNQKCVSFSFFLCFLFFLFNSKRRWEAVVGVPAISNIATEVSQCPFEPCFTNAPLCCKSWTVSSAAESETSRKFNGSSLWTRCFCFQGKRGNTRSWEKMEENKRRSQVYQSWRHKSCSRLRHWNCSLCFQRTHPQCKLVPFAIRTAPDRLGAIQEQEGIITQHFPWILESWNL